MKVLQLAPLWFPVSRDAPGGIETFLASLVAELETLGCRNTLLASGDSCTSAELWPVTPRNLCAEMEAGAAWEYPYFEQHQLLMALQSACEFDVVHSHLGWGGYALSGVEPMCARMIHTQHNPVTPDLQWFAQEHPELWFTTVSEFQARKLRQQGVKRCDVVYNGIDVGSFTPQLHAGQALCYLGRMEFEKGPDLAVQVARTLGCALILAGPVIDHAFFDRAIKPFLNGAVQYVGKVGHARKNQLMGEAGCVLLPSRWDEPFGLVAIEAMACGSPVVALAHGALPEIIEPGVTGFVAREEHELPMLVGRAMELDRATIRARVAARFDMPHVARRFLNLYQQVRASRA